MAGNCSVVNRETNEPKIVYKSDSGNIHFEYRDALKNSSKNFEIGYMQNGNFYRVAVSPKYDIKTQEGVIQHFIENGMLEQEQKFKDTYQATDNMSAEIIEEFFIHEREGLGFSRKGLNFTIPLTKPVELELEEDIQNSKFKKLSDKFGKKIAIDLIASKAFKKIMNPLKLKPTKFTEEGLQKGIESFMKKMGISTMSIEEYSKKYEYKYGERPKAKALININERIIALSNSEIALSELTEEVSHFIIENFDKATVEEVLPKVVETSYYTKYASLYRSEYAKQVGEEKAEEYVRKEVLGKMLADFLQDNFNIEEKSEVEKGIFDRISEMLVNFINYITNKKTSRLENQLYTMFSDIQNQLYNETLADDMEVSDTDVSEMYSLETSSEVKDLAKIIERHISTLPQDGIQQVGDYALQEKINVAEVLNAFNKVMDYYIKKLQVNVTALNTANGNNESIPSTTRAEIEKLLSVRNNVEGVIGTIVNHRALDEVSSAKAKSVGEKVTSLFANLSVGMKANDSRFRKDISDVIVEDLGITNDAEIKAVEEEIKNSTNGITKDASFFFRHMGNLGKASNPLVSLFSKLIGRIHNMSKIKTVNDFNDYIYKFIDYGSDVMNSLKNGSYMKSYIDQNKKQEAIDRFEYSILDEIGQLYELGTAEEPITFEMYQENPEQYRVNRKAKPEMYYAYTWAKLARSDEDVRLDSKTKKYKKEQYEKYVKLGLHDMHPLFKQFTNEASRRNIYREGDPMRKITQDEIRRDRIRIASPFDENGYLKKGLKLVPIDEVVEGEGYVPIGQNPKFAIRALTPSLDGAEYEYDDYVNNDIALVISLNEWNNSFDGIDSQYANENFKQEWDRFKNSISHLSEVEKQKKMSNWIKENAIINMSDEFWENNSSMKSSINYDALLNSSNQLTGSQRADVLRVKSQIEELELKRSFIIKQAKDSNNPKEVDYDLLTPNDLEALKRIENDIKNAREILKPLFKERKMEMFNTSDSISNFNLSFHKVFKRQTGYDFNDVTDEYVIDRFFESILSPDKNNRLSALIKAKNSKLNPTSSIGQDLKEIAKRNGYDKVEDLKIIDIKRDFYQRNLPIYFRRFDSDLSYDGFIRGLNNNAISVSELDNIINKALRNNGSIEYNGVTLKDVSLKPHYKYTSVRDKKVSEKYEDYKQMTFTNTLDKFNALSDVMGANREENSEFRMDISDILKDKNKLEALTLMMEFKLKKMEQANSLDESDPLLLPQFRHTNLSRLGNFFKKGDKMNQLGEFLKEHTSIREDDLENNYLAKKIPLYGYYKIKKEDLSDDIIYLMSQFAYETNLYEERVKNIHTANNIMGRLFNTKFKNGKTGYDSNYYQMLNDLMNVHFYGQRLTAKWEVTINGQSYDIAKSILSLKNMGVNTALMFSPVVALTNYTTGHSNIIIQKILGEHIYHKADEKARGQLGAVMSGGIKDIGSLVANDRISKIAQNFGIHTPLSRVVNAKHGTIARLAENSGYAMMQLTNYPIEMRILIGKLMEMRIIDGKLYNWESFKLHNSINNTGLSKSEIQAKFDSHDAQSLWELLDEHGNLDANKISNLTEIPLTEIQLDAMAKISDLNDEITGQLSDGSKPPLSYTPWGAFLLTLKNWMVIATSKTFSGRRYDPVRGSYSSGMLTGGVEGLYEIFKNYKSGDMSIKESFENLPSEQKSALKELGITMGVLMAVIIVASALIKYADDDDEKDNAFAQLSAYIAERTVNEISSANIGLPNNYYETLKQPIATLSLIKNLSGFLNFADMGSETKTGVYKGVDKYVANVIKTLPLKNLMSVSSAESIMLTRQGYQHFNTRESIYSLLSLLPSKSSDDDE